MNHETHWQRAFAAFRKLQSDKNADMTTVIGQAQLSEKEIAILHRLLEAERQQTEILDEAFAHSQWRADQALLKNREGEQLGEYQLLKLIGSGGMSAVYLARRTDTDIQKQVALKVLLFPSLSKDVVALFLQEQRLLSTLHHPHIVSMLHGGTATDGTPYLVMEYVPEARDIAQWMQETQPNQQQVVDKLRQLLEALDHAHSHLVVHSDIKPGNVLIDAQDNVKLVDFGISTFLQRQQRQQPQALSPAYASPEQIAGEQITIASDIYSAGLMLCHLLCGELMATTPQNGHRHQPAIEQALKKAVAEKRLDNDLKNIIQKATHPEPENRYPNARAFAQDLDRWRNVQPVTASGHQWHYRLKKFIQRRTAFSVVLALLAGAIVTGFILINQQRQKALLEAEKARQVTQFMLDAFAVIDPDQAKGLTFTAGDILDNAKIAMQARDFDQPAIKQALTAAVAAAENNLGRYQRSQRTLEPMLQSGHLDGDIIRTAVDNYLHLNQPQKARQLLQESSTLPAHQHALLMAAIVSQTDAFDEALNWLDKAQGLSANLPQSTRVQTRIARLRGDVLFNRGDNPAALAAYQKARALHRELGTENSSEAISAQAKIATIYNDAGDFDRAYPMLTDILQRQEKHFGPNHPALIPVLLQLAGNRQFKQDFSVAQQYAQRALQLATSALGPDNVLTGRALNMAGILAFRQGNIDKAIDNLRQAADIYQQRLGLNHRESGEVITTLANLLLVRGQTAEAIERIRPVAEFQRQKLGPAHKATLYSQLTLAKALVADGQHQPAAELAASALEQARTSLGEAHPMATGLQLAYADALAGLNRHAEAIQHYQAALASPFLQQQKNRQPLILARLAHSQYALGQIADAHASAQQATALAEEVYGADHPQTRAIKSQLATLDKDTQKGSSQ